MFPLDFPLKIIMENEPKGIVFDPFCGRGTTLFAARVLGYEAVGIDCNPVAVAISQAKTTSTSKEGILEKLDDILSSDISYDLPEGIFWEKAFHYETLKEICCTRQYFLNSCSSPEEIALRAIILGALHGPLPKNLNNVSYLSNQMPRTYSSKPDYSVKYWKKKGYEAPRIEIRKVVEKRASWYYSYPYQSVPACVRQGDSRDKQAFEGIAKVSMIITSPPYYGMTTYITDQWLRNWYLGGPASPPHRVPGDLGGGTIEKFILDLRTVWMNMAEAAEADAKMFIRIGSLPSKGSEPEYIIQQSIFNTPWLIKNIKSAGKPNKNRRQANQMRVSSEPCTEIDVELVM